MSRQQLSLFDRKLLGPALLESLKKLDPRIQWRNPVMFVVYLGTVVTAILYGQALAGHGEAPAGFILAITIWLLFTVHFRQLRRSARRGPQPRAGLRTSQHAPNGHGQTPAAE